MGRTAVGCHCTIANEAVQGNLGCSSFKVREDSSKLLFKGCLLFMKEECGACRVFEYLAGTCLCTKWTRRLYRLERHCGLF